MEKINYKPIKPKDASTLIIIKNDKKNTYVLMGQRSINSKFMPGVFVFPGGATEKDDSTAFKFFKLKPRKEVVNSLKFIPKTFRINKFPYLLNNNLFPFIRHFPPLMYLEPITKENFGRNFKKFLIILGSCEKSASMVIK